MQFSRTTAGAALKARLCRTVKEPEGTNGVDCGFWELCETGIEPTDRLYPPDPPLDWNRITCITETGAGIYEIKLERPVSAGHWTTISYTDDSYVTYASLPADAEGDRHSGPDDILRLIDCLNGVAACSDPWQKDIDHSNLPGPPDILRLIDLLNGASKFVAWYNKRLPANTCPNGGDRAAEGESTGAVDADLVAEANEDFIKGFVQYMAASVIPDAQAEAEFALIVDAVTGLCVDFLSPAEREAMADALRDPSLRFASQAAPDMVPEIVERLLK